MNMIWKKGNTGKVGQKAPQKMETKSKPCTANGKTRRPKEESIQEEQNDNN